MSAEVQLKKRKEIFPGWWMLIAGGIICLWGYGIYSYSFGNYVKALINEFRWTRAQISLGYSFGRLEGGIEGPFGGLAIDKFGPRAVTLVGMVIAALGLYFMSLVTSLWMFYVAWIMVAIGFNLGLADSLDAAMANWFVKRRGLSIALMRGMVSLCGVTIVPGSMALLMLYGWRPAFLISSIVTACLTIPLAWFFVKPKRPEYYGWLPDGKKLAEEKAADRNGTIQAGVEYAGALEEVEYTVRQAIADKTFWLVVVAITLRGMVAPTVNVHTVPYLTDLGISEMTAATAMGAMVFLMAPARLFVGWIGDRIPRNQLRFLVMGCNALEALGLFIFTKVSSMAWVWAFAVVYGLGQGASIMAMPPLRGRYWGRKAYATIQGSMMPITMIAGIAAPVFAGWTYDTTGSYQGAFNIILILLAVSVLIMFFATPPKRPKEITHITDVV